MIDTLDQDHLTDEEVVTLTYLWDFGGTQATLEGFCRHVHARFPLTRYLFDARDTVVNTARQLNGNILSLLSESSEELRGRILQRAQDYVRRSAPAILQRIPLGYIHTVQNTASIDSRVKWLNDRLRFLHQKTLENAALISEQYTRTLLAFDDETESVVLIELLATIVGMTARDTPVDDSLQSEKLQWYCSYSIVPNRHLHFGLAVFDTETGDYAEQLDAVLDWSNRHKGDLITLVVIGDGEEFKREFDDRMAGRRAVAIFEEDIKRIVMSNDSQLAMGESILHQLPAKLFSPYQFTGPVCGNIFFGRDREIHTILDSKATSFCLLGSRRIGKTSLLKILHQKVNDEQKLPNTIAVFLDATSHRKMQWFQRSLLQELRKQTGETCAFDPEGELDWAYGSEFFEQLGLALKRTGKRFLFLFDEVDQLVMCPEEEWLEEFVRNISNEGYARFVFSGYRELRKRTDNRSSYFYNLFDVITLGPLEDAEAYALVTEPMAKLQVTFTSDSVVEEIIKLGSTVPALLQRMCDALLERLDTMGARREITLDDVRAVDESDEFSSEMTATVNRDNSLPVLERLIVFLVVRANEEWLSEREVCDVLRREIYEPRFTEVRGALDYLTSTYIFKRTSDRYRFFLPQLKRKIIETERDINYVIDGLADEYRGIAG